MKAILMKPKLNAAFKAVQPLPVLTGTVPVDLHYAAAPRFDATWRAVEPTRNALRSAASIAAQNGAGESNRRLSAVAALAGVVQSCAAMAERPSHGDGSQAMEVRLIG